MRTVFERAKVIERRKKQETREMEKADQLPLKWKAWALVAVIVLLVIFFRYILHVS